jgi:signal transduction histidine kinase
VGLAQAAQPSEQRDTGISVLGPMPWSTHASLFYETTDDLVDTIVPFFEAGLRAGELCVWLPARPSIADAVRDGLGGRLADFDERLARRDMMFVEGDRFFRPEGVFHMDAVLERWREFAERAGSNQYAGLRGAGDQSWLVETDWPTFSDFEIRLHQLIRNRRMLLLCTYPLASHSAADMLDSAQAHHTVIARRQGSWQILETPTLKQTKERIQRDNEALEQRVAERTRQLARVKRTARERTLEARFAAAFEERTRLAREIHDSLLQGVTGIALQLRATLPRLQSAPVAVRKSIRAVVDLAESTIRDARRAVWDMRSPSLVHKGLHGALEDAVRQSAQTLDVHFAIEGKGCALVPQVEDTIFRVGHEAVINAERHAKARTITVTLSYKPRAVTLTVADDGNGFDAEQAFRSYSGRWGLLGMRERADRIGATLRIRSAARKGTSVQLSVPLKAARKRG